MAQTKCHTNQGLIANATVSIVRQSTKTEVTVTGGTQSTRHYMIVLRVGLPSLAQLTPSDQPAGGGAQVGAGHLFTLLNTLQ